MNDESALSEKIHEIAYGIPGMVNDDGNRRWLEDQLTELVKLIVRESREVEGTQTA